MAAPVGPVRGPATGSGPRAPGPALRAPWLRAPGSGLPAPGSRRGLDRGLDARPDDARDRLTDGTVESANLVHRQLRRDLVTVRAAEPPRLPRRTHDTSAPGPAGVVRDNARWSAPRTGPPSPVQLNVLPWPPGCRFLMADPRLSGHS
ncbi:hypothetical protein GCM10011578_068100 [Streptomyces fuscichromogenes]|uniref:Uncharacterized protein n=1 Tax=Streptomyces fuscichromogenes TaxID=1324013 RepID=A0A918CUY7_9ACTN|nr:hypothetical protein GCM10011578_068100 [Streptomyces fuscichromogenes]